MLALTVAAVGTGLTLLAARLWLLRWVDSGGKYPVGQWTRVEIPASAVQSLVYYESEHGIGPFMRLYVRDAYGERYQSRVPTDDNEFSVAGVNGRALFRLDLIEGGVYDVRCDNPNYAADAEIPAGDRIVFFKSPNTRQEALAGRRVIVAAGGTATIAATIGLYILHGLSLARRRRRAAAAALDPHESLQDPREG